MHASLLRTARSPPGGDNQEHFQFSQHHVARQRSASRKVHRRSNLVVESGTLVGPGDQAGESRGVVELGGQDTQGRARRDAANCAHARQARLRSARQSAQLRRSGPEDSREHVSHTTKPRLLDETRPEVLGSRATGSLENYFLIYFIFFRFFFYYFIKSCFPYFIYFLFCLVFLLFLIVLFFIYF